jgi:hypothetical protein
MPKQKRAVAKEKVAPKHITDAREAAILLLWRIALRDTDRRNPTTRAQFTVPMLRRLWNRPRLSPEFLEDVSTWLAVAGWCFFNAGATYAAVRISAVKNWPRLGTSSISNALEQVASGDFPFEGHAHLLIKGEDLEVRQREQSDSEDTEDKESNDNE